MKAIYSEVPKIFELLSNDKEGLIESGICPAQQPKFSLIFSLIALV